MRPEGSGVSSFIIVAALGVVLLDKCQGAIKLPSFMDQAMYCHVCDACLKELDKLMRKPTADSLQVRVVDSLDLLCREKSFGIYDYIPPKMVKFCLFFLDEHEDALEKILMEHYGSPDFKATDPDIASQQLHQKVCKNLSKACVDLEDAPRLNEKPKIVVDLHEREIEPEQIHRAESAPQNTREL